MVAAAAPAAAGGQPRGYYSSGETAPAGRAAPYLPSRYIPPAEPPVAGVAAGAVVGGGDRAAAADAARREDAALAAHEEAELQAALSASMSAPDAPS